MSKTSKVKTPRTKESLRGELKKPLEPTSAQTSAAAAQSSLEPAGVDTGLSSANPSDSVPGAMSTAERIELYLKALGDKDLSDISQERVLEMRKRLNPYGRTIAGSNKFLNFSITQITHEYWKKFITTAMIAYLNRMCDEWKVPNNVPVISVYDYLEKPELLNTPELLVKKGDKSALYDYEFNRQWMAKRMIVKEFLEEMFQFNPDEHVRSAYRPNYKDQSRKPLDTMAARIAVKHATRKDANLRADKALAESVSGVKTRRVKRIIKGRDGTTREVFRDVPVAPPPCTPPAPTNPEHLDPEHPADNAFSTATNFIPPHDMFGRFKIYYQENYEQLREAVLALYCEKPEFELAINPLAWHNTREEAEAFKKQHADEVITEVFTVESGKWNFFDSFKKQRESVNFYNKDTIILEEMAKQIERDERLGEDLMTKRVEKEKAKNIVEAGPDDANFKKWMQENSELSKMGAKYIGDMADEDMPEDAIQVDVWKVARGGLELTKEKFYSQAEAPTFVKEAQDRVKANLGGMTPGEMPPIPPAPASSTTVRGDNVE